jgi:outer membrane immunogenic protein
MRTLVIAAVAGSALFTGIVTAGAADMAVKAAPMAAPAPAFDWTGFYVGVNAGGAWSPNSSDPYNGLVWPAFAVLPPQAPIITIFPGQFGTLAGTGGNSSGFIGGGQIGYNWQVKQFVLGVEADGVGTDLHGSSASATRSFGPPIIPITVNQTVTVDFGHIDWMATFRGRAGIAIDRALFYVTGGAAVAGIGATTTTVVNGPGIGLPAGTFSSAGSGSTTRWGWTAGAGIEWAFNRNWSVAGEYRHSDFGSRGVTFMIPDGLGNVLATGASSSRLTVDQATARLNYRFGGPVVARY